MVAGVAVWLTAVLAVSAAALACGDDDPPAPAPSDEWMTRPARIESVEIVIAESWPPQYFVQVVSVQPDGCHEFDGYTVEREEEAIRIEVLNRVPANLDELACTLAIQMTESNIPLGTDFESGATYTVTVNGVTRTFEAQ
jgi:hypothetical protein